MVATGLAASVGGTSASARPVTTVPASRVLTLVGHGWGHGRGMSQNGAYGAAAKHGRTAAQILDFYYPGTATVNQGNPGIRVQLRSMDTASPGRIDVHNPGSLTFHDEASATTWKAPSTTSARWRVVPASTGLLVQHLRSDATWATSRTVAGPLRVDADGLAATRVLHPMARTYTSSFLRVRRLTATSQSTAVHTSMETYLRGVVPAESLASWPAATLQAQSVAARSYSTNRKNAATTKPYDICDTTDCQVYTGDAAATARTDAAIAATAGLVRTYNGKAIFAEFSASNGGWSVAGGVPYMTAKADPYDGAMASTVHTWTARLPVSALEKRWPSIGRLRTFEVTARDGNGAWGGRVETVRLVGTTGTVSVTGTDIKAAWSWPAQAAGLRSRWFDVRAAGTDVTGDGAADLVVGAPGRLVSGAAAAGAVAVVRGVPRGDLAAGGQLLSQTSTGVPDAAEQGDGFGSATAGGDFDGDGRVDVAVGVPGEGGALADVGLVQVLKGSPTGLTPTGGRALTLATPGVPGTATAGARFGAALAAADVNGDGYDDLLVGEPGAPTGTLLSTGAVTVLRGSATGLTTTGAQRWSQGSAGMNDNPEAGDRFGATLATGDVNGDGRADVVVGSPGERTPTAASGSVRLLLGAATGLVPSRVLWGSAVGNRGQFGRAVTLTDTDRDGYADLLAGGRGALGGAVTVVRGAATGLTGAITEVSQDTAGVPDVGESSDTFGAALASGDVNGDGYGDVVVGNPFEAFGTSARTGTVTVALGGATGPGAGGWRLWQQGSGGLLGVTEAGDRFGAALAVNDLDGDGFGELVAAAPGEDGSRGHLTLVYGSEQGLRTERDLVVDLGATGSAAVAGDQLGAAVAVR